MTKFQERYASSDSPTSFETRKTIALDIAQGLAFIHQSGVIHGDLKPDNVLIFEKPTLHAKIADFSHSLLDTGETRRLVGGTTVYAAPEWQRSAPTAHLLKTDVYSYGLVFAELMLGHGLIEMIRLHPPSDVPWPPLSMLETLRDLKDSDSICQYLCSSVCHRKGQSLKDSTISDYHIQLIVKVLECTVVLNHGLRDMQRAIAILQDGRNAERVNEHTTTERIDSLFASSLSAVSFIFTTCL